MAERMPSDCDFCETMLDEARMRLGAKVMGELEVCVTESQRRRARALQALHAFELVIVPDHVAVSRWVWSAAFAGRAVWSQGVL